VEGLTVLGGEPFENPLGLLQALRNIKKEVSKSIWVYTGFVYDDLVSIALAREILEEIDVLVDGEFIEDLKDLSLRFRGSSNQRVIDVKKSLENNDIIILDGYK
ncbi:4Fe-4S single cluster domain-containing protein, partial [uncultured Anaerococcus sp.]|uniref:4Fe-4S single cluster domain-containing protein n=1 Tax=uncultured Anaerococcus sp. TaxID=293428 RepID=UPI00288A9CE0